jgi:hypothetical protein
LVYKYREIYFKEFFSDSNGKLARPKSARQASRLEIQGKLAV